MVRSSFVVAIAAMAFCLSIEFAHAAEASKGVDVLVGANSPLRDGERIVFLGDSITQAGAGPGGYVTMIREAIESDPASRKVEIIPAGISGNKVPDLLARLERDVLSKKPTVVFVYIGINDVWHWQLSNKGTPKEEYEAGLRQIVKQLREAGAIVVLATPSVIGERTDGANPMDPMLDEYASISRKVASEEKAFLCDLRHAFLERLKEANPQNLDKGILTADMVHLNAEGNRLVAERAAECIAAAVSGADESAKQDESAKRDESAKPQEQPSAGATDSKADDEAGFTQLFNGKNLDGWQLVDPVGRGYVVEDGILVCPADGGGRLFTNDTYDDFVLRFEFRLSPGGNNGVGLRSPLKGDPAYVGMEVQILDDSAPQYANLQPGQYCGSVYKVAPAKRGAVRPAGEWNEEEIVCNGRHVSVTLNGQRIVDVNLDDVTDPATLKAHPGIQRTEGYIGFLGHASLVEFRNVRVKRLAK